MLVLGEKRFLVGNKLKAVRHTNVEEMEMARRFSAKPVLFIASHLGALSMHSGQGKKRNWFPCCVIGRSSHRSMKQVKPRAV